MSEACEACDGSLGSTMMSQLGEGLLEAIVVLDAATAGYRLTAISRHMRTRRQKSSGQDTGMEDGGLIFRCLKDFELELMVASGVQVRLHA